MNNKTFKKGDKVWYIDDDVKTSVISHEVSSDTEYFTFDEIDYYIHKQNVFDSEKDAWRRYLEVVEEEITMQEDQLGELKKEKIDIINRINNL